MAVLIKQITKKLLHSFQLVPVTGLSEARMKTMRKCNSHYKALHLGKIGKPFFKKIMLNGSHPERKSFFRLCPRVTIF